MSWRAGSRGDSGKAPIYATSHGDDSSDDETNSASKQAAWVLQSHFNYRGDDPKPIGSIPIETRSRWRYSIETVSVSSESHTISSGAFSQCRLAAGRGASRGVM